MKKSRVNAHGFPEEFLSKMAMLLSDEFDEFLTSLNQPSNIGIRVNTLKITPQEFSQITPYKIEQIPWCSAGFIINGLNAEPENIPPGKHIYHLAGLYYMQEPSAMAAGDILSPQPGEKVLDLAAAPGGKSTHLAALMKNTGLLIANEIHPRRVWDLAENLERCGVTNAVITNETPQRLSEHFVEFFDRVMLDAPCSGEGMFRKSLNARTEWKPESPQSCSIRQYAILDCAAQMVKLGGHIAYTTCTFSPEENEGVIARFLENHPEFDLQVIDQKPGFFPARPEWIDLPRNHKIRYAVRIWPHQSHGEGHFIALMRKNASTQKISQKIRVNQNFSKKTKGPCEPITSKALLDGFVFSNLNLSFENRRLYVCGSYMYYLPENYPNMQGLKTIHPGWWLGSIHKNHFSPSHALAMGIIYHQAKNRITLKLDDELAIKYLRGESFSHIGENAWILVTLDGFPIGWGKRVQNIVKNYYPHGLRVLY